MPVPILTSRKSSTDRASPACSSPSAIRFTSLSTSTGQPSSWPIASRTGNRSQPGMIGGTTGMPSRKLTGPGTPMPVPCTCGMRPRRAACRAGPAPAPARPSRPAGRRTGRSRGRAPPGRRRSPRRRSRWRRCRTRRTAGSATAGRSRTVSRPATPRARPLDESQLDEPVQLHRELRARQLDDVPQLGPRPRPSSRSSRSSRAWCTFCGRADMRITPSSRDPRGRVTPLSCPRP